MSILIESIDWQEFESKMSILIDKVLTQTNQSKVNDELMTTEDVAKFLGKSRLTIHNWKKVGKLPYLKISDRIFYRKGDIMRVLEQGGNI